jgi:hypothetical protein
MQNQEIFEKAASSWANRDKFLELRDSGRTPCNYVVTREVIDQDDAYDIVDDAAIRNRDIRFITGFITAYAYVIPEAAETSAHRPLQQLMISFIKDYDGGKYLTDDYEFIQYYHPAEGEAPRANKDKEYYVLVPIRKV